MVDINALTGFTQKTLAALQDALSRGDGAAVKKYDDLLQKASQLGKQEVAKLTTGGSGVAPPQEAIPSAASAPALRPGAWTLEEQKASDEYYDKQFPTAKAINPADMQKDLPILSTENAAPAKRPFNLNDAKGYKPGTAPKAPSSILDWFGPSTPVPDGFRIDTILGPSMPVPKGAEMKMDDVMEGPYIKVPGAADKLKNKPAPKAAPTPEPEATPDEQKLPKGFPFDKSEDESLLATLRGEKDAEEQSKRTDNPDATLGAIGAMKMNAEDQREAAVLEQIEKKYKEKPSAFTWENLAIMLLIGAPRAYAKYIDEKKAYENAYAREYERYDAKKEREGLRKDKRDWQDQQLKIQEMINERKEGEQGSKLGIEVLRETGRNKRADDRNAQSQANTIIGAGGKLMDDEALQRMIDLIAKYGRSNELSEDASPEEIVSKFNELMRSKR